MRRTLVCNTCKTKYNMLFEWARLIQKEAWCPVCGVNEILVDTKEE